MRSRKGGGPVKPPGQAVQATGWNTLLCVAAILLTGWIAYSNTFDCPFQFDDRTSITENEMIRSFDPVAIWNYNKYRFLPYLSFAWNYSIHQYEPGGYHLLNLLIHLINAVVVFSIVRALFETPRLKSHPLFHQRDSIALLSALLFVAHPLATQAVTYIVQRMASMAALFYFLSLWFYLRGRLSKGRAQILFFTGTLVSVLCAFVSKPNTFTLPMTIALVEAVFFHEFKPSALVRNTRFWMAAFILSGFGIFLISRFSSYIAPLPPAFVNEYREITPLSYLLTQFTVIPKYIQLLVWPANQNLDYAWPLYTSMIQWPVLLGLLSILACISWGMLQWNKNPLYAFGILFFFLALSVESGLVPLDDLIFEHRAYLPSLGFFIPVSAAVHALLNNQRSLILPVMVLITLVLTAATYRRNRVWENSETLWTDVIEKSPGKARPLTSRGFIYRNKGTELKNAGNLQGMRVYYEKAINDYSESIKYNPEFIQTYVGRGKIYFDLQMDSLAILDFQKVIDADPKNSEALSNRGAAYYRSGKYKEALRDLDKAIKLNPKNPESYTNRAITHQRLGAMEKAIDDYNTYLKLLPGNPVVLNDIGILRNQLGQRDLAIASFTKAIEAKGDFIDAYLNRANTYRDERRFDEALADYGSIIQLNPSIDKAYANRGILYQQRKSYKESVQDLTRAIELNPRYAYAFYARGVSNYKNGNADSACSDLKQAATLGNQQAAQLIPGLCR